MRGDKNNFNQTNRKDKSFKLLIKRNIELLVLDLPNSNQVFQVDCDASGSTIGAVLSQEGGLIYV